MCLGERVHGEQNLHACNIEHLNACSQWEEDPRQASTMHADHPFHESLRWPTQSQPFMNTNGSFFIHSLWFCWKAWKLGLLIAVAPTRYIHSHSSHFHMKTILYSTSKTNIIPLPHTSKPNQNSPQTQHIFLLLSLPLSFHFNFNGLLKLKKKAGKRTYGNRTSIIWCKQV